MKSARKRRVKAFEVPAEHNVGTDGTGIMQSAKRTTRKHHKTIGKTGDFSIENSENISPCSSAVSLCPQLLDRNTCLSETRKLPVLDLYPKQILLPSAKIKLQLFPIDEGTRMGLEKDGYHPYLELTLSTRKKISSVLKHLNSKWGGSSIACGELVLFPYNTVENLASDRWTMSDDNISTGDVYAAIGNPSVFRLRFGWFSNSEAKTFGVPSTLTPAEARLKSEGIQRACSTKLESPNGEVKQIEQTSKEFNHYIGNEVRLDCSIGQPSLLWADTLTNISIGGLLSEASLQGMSNNLDAKSNGSNAGLQPSQLISDSFDAFLAGQIKHSQGPMPPPHESRSSILDAENTCHAFAFEKFSSKEKVAQSLDGGAFSKIWREGAGTNSFKFPNLTKASIQPELQQGHASEESETDLLLCSRVYNDESSLGLSGIKWSDSLGPFDLGLSSSRKIISGDSNTMRGIVK